MKTPRKRITFKTPKKRQTPLVKNTVRRRRVENSARDAESEEQSDMNRKDSSCSTNSTTLDNIDSQIEKKEKENISMYRIENQYLRSLKSDAMLFKKFTGIEIFENNSVYSIRQSVIGRDGQKTIKFELREEDDAYIYRLVETNCTELPSFLQEDISFECMEVHKFFFKVLEVLVARNV